RRAAAFPFARTHMGAKYGEPRGGGPEQLLDRDGNPLSTKAIEDEMRKRGIDPENVGFVSHSPSARGAGSFYRAFFPADQSLQGPARTGEGIVRGTPDFSLEALAEQRVRTGTIRDAAEGFQRTLKDLAVPGTRYPDRRAADAAVARVSQREGIELAPVR